MMPKGQAPVLLPNTENIIIVKQKKKSFKGRVFFEPVRREKICVALTYWKYNNPLYSDIQIDEDNIMKLLVTDCTEEIPIALDGVYEGNQSISIQDF